MFFTKEQEREFYLQKSIKEYKKKIDEFLKEFYITELKDGSLPEQEKEENVTLYSQVIAILNECFFDYNVTELMKHLREKGFSIPNNDIINLLNAEELNFYKSMLSKFYKRLEKNKEDKVPTNIDDILSIAETIGKNAKKYYIVNHENTPINVLINRLTEEKQKQELKEVKMKKFNEIKAELEEYKKMVKKLTEENSNFKKVLKLEERK